jgi:CubicO group peptidase (beta-lactamase class C family)
VAAVAALAGTTQASANLGTPAVEVDTAKVAQALHQKFGGGNTVGYAFAITEDGVLAATGAGGKARVDKNIAFTPYTRMEIASATKNITAAALLKLVEKRGVGPDVKLWGYLPPDMWTTMDPTWKNLTVRQILSHTSGIDQMLKVLAAFQPEEYKKVGASYEGIKFMLSKPLVAVDPDEAPAYENMNYALARMIIPKLWDLTEPTRGVPDVMGPTDSGPWTLAYINERLFAPAGISPVSCTAANNDTAALSYDIADLSKGGYLWNAGSPNCAGHRGLQMSAIDLVRWQVHLRHGTVVSAAVRQQMDQLVPLGWSPNKANAGAWTGAFGHGGDLYDGNGRELHTCQAKFPGNVEASVLVNSKLLGGESQCTALLNAIKSATS